MHIIQKDSGEVELVVGDETEITVRVDILRGLIEEHNALTRVLNHHEGCSLDVCTTLGAVGPALVAQWIAQPRPKRECVGSTPTEGA